MSQAAPDDLLAGGGRALSIGRFRVIPERFISEGIGITITEFPN